jgi:ribosomal protein S21
MVRGLPLRQLLAGVSRSALPQPSLSSACAVLTSSRHIHITTDVNNNNVEAAYKQLSAQCRDAGLNAELKKREHFISYQQEKFAKNRTRFNKRMGQKVKERLQWVVKRSKLNV